jgi:ketosteroid isomerase-like protein
MKKRWTLGVIASAALAVGAMAAQPSGEKLALTMPKAIPASLPAAPAADASAVRAAIEAANAAWLAAFRSGDTGALARIYAPDANLFPPSNVSLEGRDRIVEYLGAQHRAGMGEASLKTLDVVRVGDVAYEVGTYGFRFGDGGSGGDAGRYFAIWKAQPDGSWRYQVGIWSSNRDVEAKR